MSTDNSVVVAFGIDETKIHILTRAARLRSQTVDYLLAVRGTATLGLEGLRQKGHPSDEGRQTQLAEDITRLDEIIAWLNEMET